LQKFICNFLHSVAYRQTNQPTNKSTQEHNVVGRRDKRRMTDTSDQTKHCNTVMPSITVTECKAVTWCTVHWAYTETRPRRYDAGILQC